MKRKLFLLLCALLTSVGMWAQTWTTGAIVAAGDYYLYNVGSGRFLNRGHNYYYRSLVDGVGSSLTLTVDESNFIIRFNGVNDKYFGADLYVDKATNNEFYSSWAFEPVIVNGLTNAYRLKCVCKGTNKTNDGKYLVWGGSNGNSNTDWATNAPTQNGYWLLIPKSTRENINGASPINPFDMTYVVKNADFEQNSTQGKNNDPNHNGWTGTSWNAKYNDNNTGAGFGTFGEQWTDGANDGKLSNREIKQTITNLPAGKYKVTVSALAAAQGKTNKADVTGVKVYVNTTEQDVATGESSKTFTFNSIEISDGDLTIGYKLENSTANWVAIDNVRLYYLGNDVSSRITNAGFDNGNSGWTGAGAVANSEVEYFGGNNAQKTFDLYQDITGLTAGIYALEAQGFYRNGSGIDVKRAKAQEEQLAVLYAMGQDNVERSTSLLSMYEEAGKRSAYGSLMGDVPNSMAQAQDFISAGCYKNNRVIVEVGNAGTLRIGGKKGTAVTNDWTVLDNFSLTKLSYSTLAEAYAAEWNASKAEATAILNSSDYEIIVSGSTQRTDLSSAVSATPSDLAGYISALSSLRTSVNNFKAAKYAYNLYAINAATATEVYNAENTTYANIIGTEKSTFNNEYTTYVSSFSPATNNAENYYNAAIAIKNATDNFTTVKASYDALVEEIAIAKGLGINDAIADSYAATSTSTAASVLTNTQELKVVEYSYITNAYPASASMLDWTENFAEDLNGEGYKTDGPTYFNEWGTGTRYAKQTLTLPAGEYAVSCIGRGAVGTNGYLYYKIGDANVVSVNFNMKGNRGRGVDTSGAANFGDGTYNCNGEGFGWEYRFLTFSLNAEASVEIGISAAFSSNWVSIYAPQLLTTTANEKSVLLSTITQVLKTVPTGNMNSTVQGTLDSKKTAAENASGDNTVEELQAILNELVSAIDEANTSVAKYADLKTAIDKANAIKDANNLVTTDATAAFENEITTATTAWDNGTYTNDEATAEITTLGTAVSGHHGNASGAAGTYIVSAWDTHTNGETAGNWDGYYINTWSNEGDIDGSGFSVPFFEYYVANNQNLPAKTMTATLSGLENGVYEVELWARVQRRSDADFNADNSMITMSVNGGDAVSIMSDTGHNVGSGTSVMRLGHYTARGVVADGTLALKIDVKLGANVHWLSWRDVKYSKLDEANMAVNATAKWGTFCAPFEVAIPNNVTAYTCASATDGKLNLVPVATTIPANTPVILNAESGLASTTFYGKKVANATDDLITEGLLVGNVSTSTKDVPSDGSAYLLQLHDAKVGFYKANGTGYLIGNNRCYLLGEGLSDAREAFFFEDDATAISALEAAKAEDGALKDGKYMENNRIFIVKNGVKYGANGQKLN